MPGSSVQQLAERLANGLALLLGYPSVVERHGYRGAWCLSGLVDSPDVRIFSREQDLHMSDVAPPRIVMVAQGGDIISPDRVGSLKDETGKPIKCIRVRKFGVRIYCWGQDSDQSETLYTNTMLAIQGTGTGSAHDNVNGAHNAVNFSQEVWEDQQTGEGGQETFGAQISFLATWDLMVVTTTMPTRLVRVARINNAIAVQTPGQPALLTEEADIT